MADKVPSKSDPQEFKEELVDGAVPEDPKKEPEVVVAEGGTPAETDIQDDSSSEQVVLGATPAEDKQDKGASWNDTKEGTTSNTAVPSGSEMKDKSSSEQELDWPPVKQKPKIVELELPTPKEGDKLVFVSRFTSELFGKKSLRGIGAFSDQSFRFYIKTGDYTAIRGRPTYALPFTYLEAVIKRADDKPPKPVLWPKNAAVAASVVLRIGGKPSYFFFDDEESANDYIDFLTAKQKELYVPPEPKKKRGPSVKKESTRKKPAEGPSP